MSSGVGPGDDGGDSCGDEKGEEEEELKVKEDDDKMDIRHLSLAG